jgi:hypothetical protein
MKQRCCPYTPFRKITRSIHEQARDVAREMAKRTAYRQSRRDRQKVEMLFAHFKRILKMDRLRLRGRGGDEGEPAGALPGALYPGVGAALLELAARSSRLSAANMGRRTVIPAPARRPTASAPNISSLTLVGDTGAEQAALLAQVVRAAKYRQLPWPGLAGWQTEGIGCMRPDEPPRLPYASMF